MAMLFSATAASSAVANPFIAEGRKPEVLIPEIVNACMDNGDAVIDTSPYLVACEALAKPTMGNAFMGSLLYGARNSQMKLIYRWVIAPHEAGSRVRLQATFEADQGRGSVFREDWSDRWQKEFPRTIARLKLTTEGDYIARVAAERSKEASEAKPALEPPPMPTLPSERAPQS